MSSFNRKHRLLPPSEATRVVLATWQQISDTYRLPDSVARSVYQNARLVDDAARREPTAHRLWSEHRIGTAQLIAIGCLIPDTLEVSPSARRYCPAPNADHLLTLAIAAPFFPRHLSENGEIPSRYFEIQTGHPRPKMGEIGRHHGA
jgi:hypothetical protein